VLQSLGIEYQNTRSWGRRFSCYFGLQSLHVSSASSHVARRTSGFPCLEKYLTGKVGESYQPHRPSSTRPRPMQHVKCELMTLRNWRSSATTWGSLNGNRPKGGTKLRRTPLWDLIGWVEAVTSSAGCLLWRFEISSRRAVVFRKSPDVCRRALADYIFLYP
jgi:hypothetical protein